MNYQSEMIVLENEKIVDIVTDVKSMHYLRPFMNRPLTLSEASQELGIAMNSYHYWITKFVKYGLLIVAYTKKRAGSSIKYYITPAKKILLKINKRIDIFEEYYNSYSQKWNLSYLTSQAILDEIKEYNFDLGILLKVDSSNDYWTVPVMISNDEIISGVTNEMLKVDSPSAFSSFREFYFRPEDAKEFQRKLVALMVEYESRVDFGGEKYLVEVAMAPDRERKKTN